MPFPSHSPHAADPIGMIRTDVCPDCRELVAGWLNHWAQGDQRSYVLRLRDDMYGITKDALATDKIVDLLTGKY